MSAAFVLRRVNSSTWVWKEQVGAALILAMGVVEAGEMASSQVSVMSHIRGCVLFSLSNYIYLDVKYLILCFWFSYLTNKFSTAFPLSFSSYGSQGQLFRILSCVIELLSTLFILAFYIDVNNSHYEPIVLQLLKMFSLWQIKRRRC